MKKVLVTLLSALLLLPMFGCDAESNPTPEPQPTPFQLSGHWELVSSDFQPISDSRPIAGLGELEGVVSPDATQFAYASNKDNPDQSATSIFLQGLDAQQEEHVLLSSGDGKSYLPLLWLDDAYLLCTRVSGRGDVASQYEYLLCDTSGAAQVLPIQGVSTLMPFAQSGWTLAFLDAADQTTMRLLQVGSDYSITELAQKTFDGYPINNGAISPDGTMVVFPLRPGMESADRSVCIWNTATDEILLLPNPTPDHGTDPAAINVYWDDNSLRVDFSLSSAESDLDVHDELWAYIFE